MDKIEIPFNKPFLTGNELSYIKEAQINNMLAGDGNYTKLCHGWLEKNTGSAKALLTHSCTAALEMAALLIGIEPGDEVILPSYTFVSTANAFVLRGATIVFVDIRADTLNINENLIEDAITQRTRLIVPVHYAGVSCEMDVIMDIARRHDLKVVEDAAQAIMSTYKGRPLGAIGNLGAYSFHETKNVISGEGGALLVNDNQFKLRAEIIREKGTDRSKFFRGEVDKYTWQEPGSSFLPGELSAAYLFAQLEAAEEITKKRLVIWERYHRLFEEIEKNGYVKRPIIPANTTHNAHIYYLVLKNRVERDMLLSRLRSFGIGAVFHYVPLHSSPGGLQYGRISGEMKNTDQITDCLIRLPMWVGLTEAEQNKIATVIAEYIYKRI